MSRPSLFVLVVLVGAAAVAGLVALTRSSAATEAKPTAGPTGQAQIGYRLKQLDKVEAELRKKIAAASKPVPATKAQGLQAQPTVVLRPALASVSGEREDEHGEDERGEHGEREHDDDHGYEDGERDD